MDNFTDKIDKSNEEAIHKVSSIGNRHQPTQDELKRSKDHRLNEFLGNLPPAVVLTGITRGTNNQSELEHRQWCYLGNAPKVHKNTVKVSLALKFFDCIKTKKIGVFSTLYHFFYFCFVRPSLLLF